MDEVSECKIELTTEAREVCHFCIAGMRWHGNYCTSNADSSIYVRRQQLEISIQI